MIVPCLETPIRHVTIGMVSRTEPLKGLCGHEAFSEVDSYDISNVGSSAESVVLLD